MTSRSDLCKSVSRPDLHLETPLQEKSNCSHALFGHHPALFIPFSTLNIHILPGVNFKIPPPPPLSLSVECQTFFHRVVRPPSSSFFFFDISPLSLSVFLHLFDLSTVKPGPDTYEGRETSFFLERKYSTSPFHDHDGLWIFFFF